MRGTPGKSNYFYKHGLGKKGPWNCWVGIKKRCLNSKDKLYSYYGGRGIQVCKEWLEYPAFYEWALRNGWAPGLTIERMDVNGNYCPENCIFIPKEAQTRNRRSTIWVEVEGEKLTLKEAARHYGLAYKLVHCRYRKLGWSLEKALSTPSSRKGVA